MHSTIPSCLPNVTVRFNPKSFASEVRAVRNIKVGEELLVSYANTSLSQEERQRNLDQFAFKCRCPICINPQAIALRKRIQDNAKLLDPAYTNGIVPGIASKRKRGVDYRAMIKNSEKWMRILEDADMQESELYSKYLSVAVNAALVLRDEKAMRKYVEKRLVWAKAVL
jgi:hypothetical protein